MKQFKLGFRNRSHSEQLQICDRAVVNAAKLPEEQRASVRHSETSDAVAAARESFERVAQLRGELRAEISRSRSTLRIARDSATRTSGMMAGLVSYDPLGMVKAGLELVKDKAPVGKPVAPDHFHAVPHGDSGARLRWKRGLRRDYYQVQMLIGEVVNEADWKHCDSPVRTSCNFKDLESGKKYWFRVQAFNAHGHGPWSQPVSVRVK